jgi:hypothetical protein
MHIFSLATPLPTFISNLYFFIYIEFLSPTYLYHFSVRLHIILTPPNLPLLRGGAVGGRVVPMYLYTELVLVADMPLSAKKCGYYN